MWVKILVFVIQSLACGFIYWFANWMATKELNEEIKELNEEIEKLQGDIANLVGVALGEKTIERKSDTQVMCIPVGKNDLCSNDTKDENSCD